MGMQKWLILDHLIDAIRYVEKVNYLQSGFCEKSLKIFKTFYAKRSKQRKFAVDEAIKRYEKIWIKNFRCGKATSSRLININPKFIL